MGIHETDELRIIRIAPEPCRMFPWHLALDLQAVCQLIEHNALEVGVILHDQGDVVEVVF